MNESIVLVILLVVGVPVVAVFWLVSRVLDDRQRIDALSRRLARLENDAGRVKQGALPSIVEEHPKPVPAPPPLPKLEPVAPIAIPRPAPASPPPTPAWIVPPAVPSPAPVDVPAKAASSINWEQFMGVKLFAWLGGLALFLGVSFFVKYSFDNNLVPPALRAALGFLAGLGLMVGGVLLSRKNYPALSQTLCATGVVILYAVTYACHSIYRFPWFGAAPTFLIMVAVTAAAFVLADRLNALVVAILGMLGGFLAPLVLATGQDNPLALFGYIAILDTGLVLVALRRRWDFVTALAAAATVFMQIGWVNQFFVPENYVAGGKIFVVLAVLLGFQLLYVGACAWARSRRQTNDWLSGGALGLAASALVFSGWLLTLVPLAGRPALMFSFVFLIDAGIAALVLLDPKMVPAQSIAGLAIFGLLGYWTTFSLASQQLVTALIFYFVFAVWHAAFPLWLQRRRGLKPALWAGHVFPALALLVVLAPIFKFDNLPFVVWPFVFVMDVVAVALSFMLGSVISVPLVLVLSLVATGAVILKIPESLAGLPVSFYLLGAFAAFFVVASVWLVRKLRPAADGPENLTAQLPVFSAVLPFLLLIMAAARLPLDNPTPLFALALGLVVLLLGVTKLLSIDLLPAVGLICVTALECEWHLTRFNPAAATVPLVWYLVFLGVFTLFPFLFLRQMAGRTLPWVASAMAGVPQFFLVHRLMLAAHPNPCMGLLPMGFAVPPLLGLSVLLRKIPVNNKAHLAQLAWFGGVALFFITLIFPVQFERQWITIGWALEGAALLWLFHRVPHPGLQWVGAGLLALAFARLALNPAVLSYHPRGATPILNWYLYAYGLVTACLYVGARLTAPPRHWIAKINAPPVLAGLGTVLAFLLLNIEIADFFSAPGSTLTFQFNGNFARDMTYSIAWALFALALLVAGIVRKMPASRYAALGLLSMTLLKLFLHDLAQLGQLYRIAAFISVAIIAMLASFAYQRFFAAARVAR